MAKHFTRACIANGYAGTGNSMARPHYPSASQRSTQAAIEHARRVAANEARARSKKK